LPHDLRRELAEHTGGEVFLTADSAAPDSVFGSEWDIILLLNALDWYVGHRLRIKGRPWVCAAAWVFDGIRPVTRFQMADIGVRQLFVNMPGVLEEFGTAFPARFTWPPLPSRTHVRRSGPLRTAATVGTVVPNIADRDFVLLEEVRRIAEQLGIDSGRFQIHVPYGTDPRQLPGRLGEHVNLITPDGFNEAAAYGSLDWYVPAPRITDYRAGILPYELIRAVAAGCLPLMIEHPVYEPLEAAYPSFRSFDRWKTAVESAFRFGKDELTSPIREELVPTPAQFIREVLAAHRGDEHEAAAR
jgi:hypothetical protein